MMKLWVWVLILICAAGLFCSVFWMVAPPEKPASPPQSPYLLRDWGGRLALFRFGESVPIETYPLYTHLLPAADVESLRRGIPLQNPEQLEQLLEDFGA